MHAGLAKTHRSWHRDSVRTPPGKLHRNLLAISFVLDHGRPSTAGTDIAIGFAGVSCGDENLDSFLVLVLGIHSAPLGLTPRFAHQKQLTSHPVGSSSWRSSRRPRLRGFRNAGRGAGRPRRGSRGPQQSRSQPGRHRLRAASFRRRPEAAAAGDAAAEQDADTGNQTPEERRAARRAARQQNQDGQATEEETPRSRAPISRPRRRRKPRSTRTPKG